MHYRTRSNTAKIPDNSLSRALALRPDLPLPHPLDFDWRFAPTTADLLLSIARRTAHPQDGIALLGTPTLAATVTSEGWSGRVTLLERNLRHKLALGGRVDFIPCDIVRDDIQPIGAGIVIADPPWYEADTIAFCWAASRLCRIGGIVGLSVPPPTTRPGIDQERRRIIRAAAVYGLQHIQTYDGILGYETPFFESNARFAAGLPESGDWRKGDLAIFIRTIADCSPRPACPVEPVWIEQALGLTQFRLKQENPTLRGSPLLQPIVSGDILPSVSRRDPRRRKADVWTSGNRIFECEDTATLALIFGAMERGFKPEDAIAEQWGRTLATEEISSVSIAVTQLLDVVKCESVERRRVFRNEGRAWKLGPVCDRPIALHRAG